MAVITKFCGIAIRRLIDPTFGTHFHAFYGDSELVIGLNPVRVIQGDAPDWVRKLTLEWVACYQAELFSGHRFDQSCAPRAPV